jgi:hypothetical protein
MPHASLEVRRRGVIPKIKSRNLRQIYLRKFKNFLPFPVCLPCDKKQRDTFTDILASGGTFFFLFFIRRFLSTAAPEKYI